MKLWLRVLCLVFLTHGVLFITISTNRIKSADEVPEISVCCIFKDDTIVARLKYNPHQSNDVKMLEFAVYGNFPP